MPYNFYAGVLLWCPVCDKTLSMKDRRTNEELRKLLGVEPITTVIINSRLRWYGHGMKTNNEG